MWSKRCLFLIAFVQLASAMLLPNSMPIRTPVTAAHANGLPRGMAAFANMPNAWPKNKQITTNLPVSRNNFGYPNPGMAAGARRPSIAEALNLQPGSRPRMLDLNIGDPFAANNVKQDNPIGLNIVAGDLRINGDVSVAGRLPFLGAVAINSYVPSKGAGTVQFGCGAPNGRL